MANKNFAVSYYQTLKEVFWPLVLKNARFVKKNAKFNVKMFKLFQYHWKLCGNLLSNPRGGSMTPS